MFSTPEISVHVLYKNREISPLGREEGYGGKDPEKRWVLRREWKTPWDTPTTDLGAESELGNGGEHSEVADWQGTRREGGSLFTRLDVQGQLCQVERYDQIVTYAFLIQVLWVTPVFFICIFASLVMWSHQLTQSSCIWHRKWNASSFLMSEVSSIHDWLIEQNGLHKCTVDVNFGAKFSAMASVKLQQSKTCYSLVMLSVALCTVTTISYVYITLLSKHS